MTDVEGQTPGHRYLEHLSDEDLAVLGSAGARNADAVRHGSPRSRPDLVESLLERPSAFEEIFSAESPDQSLLHVSPFLVFALAVHRCHQELGKAPYVTEWAGPKRRLPIMGSGDLEEALADPWRRLFLAELLASFTHVVSGSVFVQTRRGWRRRRFSELDPVRLASLLEVVPTLERTGIYRRLGDLALFLTGVFPDHTATHGFSTVEEGRLLRAGRISGLQESHGAERDPEALPDSLADLGAVGLLERLGQRWYQMAVRSAPSPPTRTLQVVGQIGERFGQTRRVINFMTDRYLFPYRDQWFSASTA